MFELFDPCDEVCIREGGNLPHWYQPGVTYFITFRTADSIPEKVAKLWRLGATSGSGGTGWSPAEPSGRPLWPDCRAQRGGSSTRRFHANTWSTLTAGMERAC